MSNLAENFRFTQAKYWESGKRGYDDAVERAVNRLGAIRLGPIEHDGYRDVPGDMPASLYRFRDGSLCIIGDDGSWCSKAPKQNRFKVTADLDRSQR